MQNSFCEEVLFKQGVLPAIQRQNPCNEIGGGGGQLSVFFKKSFIAIFWSAKVFQFSLFPLFKISLFSMPSFFQLSP